MSSSTFFPHVGVIVLSHNGIHLTLKCLESITAQDYSFLDVFVVDNNSEDRTPQIVSEKFPKLHVVAVNENLGYAGGNNLGIQAARDRGCDLYFLVNNDTYLSEDCISTLVKAVDTHPEAGVIGPMVHTFEAERKISSAGGMIDWRYASAVNEGAGEFDHAQYPARPVDFINGCGLMVTRKSVEKAGLLDPRYFMYWEETDWCMRIRQAGLKVLFEPKAQMQHKATLEHNTQSPTTIYYLTRNRLLFFGRYSPYPAKMLALYSAVHGAVVGIGKHRRAGRIAHAKATQIAIMHAFQHRWGRADASLWLPA